MKKIFFQFAIFLAALATVLPLQAKVVDRVVAVVNSDVVTLFDLDRAMAMNKKATQTQVLDNLIQQKLLEQEVAKSKIEVTNDELARGIANVLQQNQATIEQLQFELASKGISFDSFKEQLSKEIRQGKFIQQTIGPNVQIADRDVENYKANRPELSNADDMQIEREIYNEQMEQEINNYLLHLRRKAFVEIRE